MGIVVLAIGAGGGGVALGVVLSHRGNGPSGVVVLRGNWLRDSCPTG